MDRTPAEGPPRAALIASLVIAVVAVGVVLGIAVARRPDPRPVAIAAVPAPRAEDPACGALFSALPDNLGAYRRAETADPTPVAAAAWRDDPAGEPVILRCGLGRPAEFVVGAPLQLVDDVQWFRIADPLRDLATWVAVDRPVYVALTLPSGSGPTPIQDISAVISRTLPARPIDPAPAR